MSSFLQIINYKDFFHNHLYLFEDFDLFPQFRIFLWMLSNDSSLMESLKVFRNMEWIFQYWNF